MSPTAPTLRPTRTSRWWMLGEANVRVYATDDFEDVHRADCVHFRRENGLPPERADEGRRRARATVEAVDLVAVLEQKLREIRTVLPGEPGDECMLHAPLILHCQPPKIAGPPGQSLIRQGA